MPQMIPTGYNDVLNALLKWGRSGLIPNTKVVKSYFPPVQDPVTGIKVLVPATMYITGDLGDRSKIKHSNIDDLPNTAYSGSSVGYALAPNDAANTTLGSPAYVGTTKITKAPDEIANNALGRGVSGITGNPDAGGFFNGMDSSVSAVVETRARDGGGPNGSGGGSPYTMAPGYMVTAANNAYRGRGYRQAALKSNDQAEYQENTKSLLNDTIADRAGRYLEYSTPYVTDNLSDAKVLYSTPETQGSDSYQRFTDRNDMDFRTTKVPCAIPGVLNACPTSTSDFPAVYPTFNFTTPITVMSDNPPSVKSYLEQYTGNDTETFIIAGNDYKQEMIQDVAVDAPVYLNESPFKEGIK